MKYYNNIKSLLCASLLLLAGGTSFTSCTDWLDKDPEAVIPDDEAFKNFSNFQGFIEEIYAKIPNKEDANYCSAWNFGDDAVHNTEGFAHMDHQVDLGNYRNWYNNTQCWLNGDRTSLWRNSWYCIRKCNLGIERIKTLVGTDEERDILLGQLYFFRAWWHFQLMMYFGGMPYIDKAFESDAIPELPRLSFRECADRCAEDFLMAIDLLPDNWDTTLAGQKTAGNNDLRVNKTMATCYLGKCYLWAASPLMNELEKSKGGKPQLLGASSNGKTYEYDEKYCKLAAETFGKVLKDIESGESRYSLAEFKYISGGIYDHEKDPESESNFSEIFVTVKQSWKMPGSTEAIFRGMYPGTNVSNWNHNKIFGPKVAGIVDHDKIIHHPTANLIDQYGMSNGQPIYLVKNGALVLNPNSGWDPEHPYKNRDPRFYHDIVFDGFHYVLNTEKLTNAQKPYEYCNLSTGADMRSVLEGSSTGYFIQKLAPHQCNEGDRWYDWDYAVETYIPYMRVADIYLMYAEAQGVVGGPGSSASTCPALTAIDAVNRLHQRLNSDDYPLADVPASLYTTKNDFIDVVRRERAVELAFEGFRWNDLQRWLLLTEAPYTVKYSHEFERVEKDDFYKSNDPKDARVANWIIPGKELITRRLESKHYWFPLPDKDTYLYEGFEQNPGW